MAASASDLATEIVQSRKVLCDKHGEFDSIRTPVGRGFLPWTTCPKCSEERDAEEQRQDQARRRQAAMAAAGIPKRHARASFDGYQATLPAQQRAVSIAREYAARFPDHLDAGRCMLFMGGTGTGKTHLAVAILRVLAAAGRPVYYATVSEAVQMLRDTWRKDSNRSEIDVMDFLRSRELLVLDEAGVQYGSDAERVQITNVIDARYRDMRPTLIVSNCDIDQLREYLGERVLSRLRENGGKGVIFDWKDHRGGT